MTNQLYTEIEEIMMLLTTKWIAAQFEDNDKESHKVWRDVHKKIEALIEREVEKALDKIGNLPHTNYDINKKLIYQEPEGIINCSEKTRGK